MTEQVEIERQVLPIEQIIDELKEIFDINDVNTKDSYENNGKFGINKQFMERFDVVKVLQGYFSTKMFEPRIGLRVGSITFIYTTFEVVKFGKNGLESL